MIAVKIGMKLERKDGMDNFFNIIFNDELTEALTPEELILVALTIEVWENAPVSYAHRAFHDFYDSSAYYKLFDLWMHEMPYGTAKARTGDPELWIINKLKKGMTNDNQT